MGCRVPPPASRVCKPCATTSLHSHSSFRYKFPVAERKFIHQAVPGPSLHHFYTFLVIMPYNKHFHLLQGASSLSLEDGHVTPPSRVSTPLRNTPKSLRPYVYALMAFKQGRSFQAKPSKHRSRRLSQLASAEGPFAPALIVSNSPTDEINQCKLKLLDSICRYLCRLQRLRISSRSRCHSRQHIPP